MISQTNQGTQTQAKYYPVVEHFISINGEGPLAGQLALFIRFRGCNLNCSYCDTTWANCETAPAEMMTATQIHDMIIESGILSVTLTGGEPLLGEGRFELIKALSEDRRYHIEIETNGSMAISAYKALQNPPAMTLDYKLPGSGMEKAMNTENYAYLTGEDTVKFVAGSLEDLEKAHQIIRDYDLANRCHVYLSPVFGRIEPAQMVDYMAKHKMNHVKLQLQMHKFIWDPMQRGV